MKLKSISLFFMAIAVLLINVHAAIPHTHHEASGDCSELTSQDEGEPTSPFDDLWHFDLGEDHLEVFKVSSKVKIFFPAQVIRVASFDNLISELNWVFPLEESAIPPPLLSYTSLRAPPIFA